MSHLHARARCGSTIFRYQSSHTKRPNQANQRTATDRSREPRRASDAKYVKQPKGVPKDSIPTCSVLEQLTQLGHDVHAEMARARYDADSRAPAGKRVIHTSISPSTTIRLVQCLKRASKSLLDTTNTKCDEVASLAGQAKRIARSIKRGRRKTKTMEKKTASALADTTTSIGTFLLQRMQSQSHPQPSKAARQINRVGGTASNHESRSDQSEPPPSSKVSLPPSSADGGPLGLLAAKHLALVVELADAKLRGEIPRGAMLQNLEVISLAAEVGLLTSPQIARSLWVAQQHPGARGRVFARLLDALGLQAESTESREVGGDRPSGGSLAAKSRAFAHAQVPDDSPLLALDMNQMGHVARAVAHGTPGLRPRERERMLLRVVEILEGTIQREMRDKASDGAAGSAQAPAAGAQPDWPWVGVLSALQALSRLEMAESAGARLVQGTLNAVKGHTGLHPDPNTLCRLINELCRGVGDAAVVREMGRRWQGGGKRGDAAAVRRPTSLEWFGVMGACVGRLQRRLSDGAGTSPAGGPGGSSGGQRGGAAGASDGARLVGEGSGVRQLTLSTCAHTLLSLRSAGMVCPPLVRLLLDRFEAHMQDEDARAPPPEACAAVTVALCSGFERTGVFSEEEAHNLAVASTDYLTPGDEESSVQSSVSSKLEKADSGETRDRDRSHTDGSTGLLPADDADSTFFLRRAVSREMDALVSVEMFLTANGGQGTRRLSPDTGVGLLAAVAALPIELPLLRAQLVNLIPSWAPRLSHASLGKAGMALAALGEGTLLPSAGAAIPAATLGRHSREKRRAGDGNREKSSPADTLQGSIVASWQALDSEVAVRGRAAAALAMDDVARRDARAARRAAKRQETSGSDAVEEDTRKLKHRSSASANGRASGSKAQTAAAAGRGKARASAAAKGMTLGNLAAMFAALAQSECWRRGSYDSLYAVADAIGNSKRKDLARASPVTLRRIHGGVMQVLHSGDEGARGALQMLGSDAPRFAAAEAIGGLGTRMQAHRSSAVSLVQRHGREAVGALRLLAPAGAIVACEGGTSLLGQPESWSVAGAGRVGAEGMKADPADGLLAPNSVERATALDGLFHSLKALALGNQVEVEPTPGTAIVARAFGYLDGEALAQASVAFAGDNSTGLPAGRAGAAAGERLQSVLLSTVPSHGSPLSLGDSGRGEVKGTVAVGVGTDVTELLGYGAGGSEQLWEGGQAGGSGDSASSQGWGESAGMDAAAVWASVFNEPGGVSAAPTSAGDRRQVSGDWRPGLSTGGVGTEPALTEGAISEASCASATPELDTQTSPQRGVLLSEGLWVDAALPASRTAVFLPDWRSEQPRNLEQMKLVGMLGSSVGQEWLGAGGDSLHASGDGDTVDIGQAGAAASAFPIPDQDILAAVRVISSSKAFHRLLKPATQRRIGLLRAMGWAVVDVPLPVWTIATGTARPVFPPWMQEEEAAAEALRAAGRGAVLGAMVRRAQSERENWALELDASEAHGACGEPLI